MKRRAYKKAWSVLIIAAVMVVIGFVCEPLIAVLGMTVMMTSVLASSMERKNRKYEELAGEKVFDDSLAAEREMGFVPHRAV